MKTFSTFRSLGLVASLAVLSAGSALAQDYRITVDKPSVQAIQSPDISTNVSKKFSPKDWIELEAQVKVEAKPEPKSGYIDSMDVSWYVLVPNPEQSKQLFKITRTIKHVNVPVDEEVYVSAYLSPAVVRRLTGSDNVSSTALKSVGVEVLINGRATKDSMNTSEKMGGRVDWWNVSSASVAETTSYKLMAKNETPYATLWWDRYVEVDPEQR